jgi:hypothetical protein
MDIDGLRPFKETRFFREKIRFLHVKRRYSSPGSRQIPFAPVQGVALHLRDSQSKIGGKFHC